MGGDIDSDPRRLDVFGGVASAEREAVHIQGLRGQKVPAEVPHFGGVHDHLTDHFGRMRVALS